MFNKKELETIENALRTEIMMMERQGIYTPENQRKLLLKVESLLNTK